MKSFLRTSNYSIYDNAGAENPTYLKENGDKIVAGAMLVGVTSGIAGIFYGLYSMSNGINKIK